VVKKSLKKPKR